MLTTISFLSADRSAGGIQRALRDWASVISETPEWQLTLHAPDTPALRSIASDLSLSHKKLTNTHRLLFRTAPITARLQTRSDIVFVHNGFLIAAARHLATNIVGVCHNDKPAKFQGADHLICLTPDGVEKAYEAGWRPEQVSCIPHFISDTPMIQTSGIQTPEIQTSGIQTPEIQTSGIQTPEIQTPEIQAPEIQAPEIQAPEIQAPEIQAPEIQAPLTKDTGTKRPLHIISAGRLVAKKHFSLFIEAAALAKSANPDLQFTLAGTGPEAANLAQQNAALGHPVSLIGWADLSQLAASADIFCSPSLDEPYGYVFTEMMQAGLAILATPSFGAKLILDKGKIGPLLPFTDATKWAEAIIGLDKDRRALTTLKQNSIKRLEDPIFSRNRFAEDIRTLISSQLK